MTTAFLFPGQGSQRVGMGEALLRARPQLVDRCFAAADEAAGLPVRRYALEGPLEALTRTDVAQPALFALSVAVHETARELGITAEVVAGHSLGEYTAAVAAGSLSFQEGIALVAERGRLMAAAQDERPGAMAAILGLPVDAVEQLCLDATRTSGSLVAPANLNAPTQVVVSGEVAGVDAVVAAAPGAGALKAVRLQVGAAFHSALMQPAQARMAELMARVTWRDPEVPMASNASGVLVRSADEVRTALVQQIASPVRWVDCVTTMVSAGVERVLELGPGKTLCGLVRQIDRGVATAAADSVEALEAHVPRSAG